MSVCLWENVGSRRESLEALMESYLVIAAELAVLYYSFWYVFIRETKPYKIRGPLWGFYDSNARMSRERDFQTLMRDTIWRMKRSTKSRSLPPYSKPRLPGQRRARRIFY